MIDNYDSFTYNIVQYCLELGADCPFFIYQEPIRATETGAKFQQINLSLKGKYVVLIKPDIHISTAEAYSGVKLEGAQASLDMSVLGFPEQWKVNYINSFEYHLFKAYPLLNKLKSSLYHQGAIYASMSGSGSTIFGIFNSKSVLIDEWKAYFTVCKKLK